MLNFWRNNSEIITIKEKINLKEKLIVLFKNQKSYQNDLYSPKDKTAQTWLIRNLKTDTFNLELGTFNHNWAGNDVPYVVINNEIYHNGQNNNALYNYQINQYKVGFRYKVPYPALKGTKFHNLEVGVFGVDYQKNSPYIHYLIAPQFIPTTSIINLGYEQVLWIQTIKSICFWLPSKLKNLSFLKSGDDEIMQFIPKIKFFYNNMFIVPQEIHQNSHNKTLLKIYLSNDDNSPVYNDFLLNNGFLKTTSINKKLTISFKLSALKSQQNFQGHNAFLIGDVEVNDWLSYDYDKKNIIEDFAKDSEIGDLIPFNFRGNYTHEINLNLNQSFLKFKIRLIKKIKQPWLDVNDGIINLTVQDIPEHLDYNWKINERNLWLIRNQLKKNKTFFSLIGINRLSERIK